MHPRIKACSPRRMSKQIQAQLLDMLGRRNVWEQRQRVWYEMVRDGLSRKNKPFPGAANLHLPIADNAVEKLKPYYVNSVFSRPVLASFTPMGAEPQTASASAAAAECLDWKLRKESNYPKEFAYFSHLTLTCGRALMKCRWDAEARGGKGRLCHEAIDPLYFIAEPECDSPDEMDLFAHVKQISVSKYKRTPQYEQSEELIAQIRGGDNQAGWWKESEKEWREGLSNTTNKDIIILWESWERVEEGWLVRTFSPNAPDRPVREPFLYELTWQGEPLQPFVAGQIEITEKGWYSSRGIVEKVAPYEAYGTKMWNQKADWLEYCSKPLFERDPQAVLGSTVNTKLKPGEVLPPGLKPAAMPAPPMVLDEEINQVRAMAEESASVPDFGVTPEGDQKQSRTATEMQYIGSFANQGIQYKAWINGLFEGEIYKRDWALLVKYGGKELTFFSSRSRQVLPVEALHDNYLVEPDAQPDTWNKEQRIRREFARFQLFRNDPHINQDVLYTRFISAEDPRLAKELYIPSAVKAGNEREDEAMEILILLEGYPAQAMPGEDHVTRLRMLCGKLQQLSMLGVPHTPEEMARAQMGRQRIQEHVGQHMALLAQENPKAFQAFKKAISVVDPMAGGMSNGARNLSVPSGPGFPEAGGPTGGGLPGMDVGQPALNGAPAPEAMAI